MRINLNTFTINSDKLYLILILILSFFNFNFLQAQCQIANAGPSRTLCVGSTPVMAANTATGGGIGTWTKISGSGVITSPNSPVTTITGLTAGISTFMWTITNGTCSTNSSMNFTVGPSASAVGPNQTVCATGGSALLAGNTPAVGTGLWVKVSGSGTITNPNQFNSTITGLTTGTTVLTWSVSYSSCAASVSNMTIVTKAPPTVANAGPSQTLCATTGTASATLAGNAPAVGTGVWVLVSGSGTITNPLLRNTTVTNISPGQTVLTWSISNPPCASSVSNMTITTNALPSISAAGPDQTVCVTSSAIMAANTPTAGTGLWTLVGGSGTIVSPNSPNTAITGLGVGNNTFRWRISNAPCTASSDNIVVVGTNTPSISNAGPNQTLCATTGTATATLAGNAPAVGTGSWTIVSGSGTITNPLLRNTTVTGLTPGVTVLMWGIRNPPCSPSASSVTLTINAPPSVAAAGPDQTVCVSSSATMAANTTTAGSGLWTLIGGSGTITTPTNPATTITGLGVGNNTFQWTTSNSPCANTTDNIIIVGKAVPAIANAGPSQTICASTGSTTLAGNVPATGTGAWIKVSGPGVVTNSLLANSTVTGLTAGTTVLTWSISNPPCSSSTSNMTITTNGLPTTANAGPNQTVCVSSGATMTANTPVTGTGAWTLISGSGTITNILSPTTSITGLGAGANVFQWTISNPPCASSVSNVTITGIANPSIANAGSDQTVCISSPSTIMAANTATIGTGAWTLISGSGTITNSLSPVTSITGLGTGVNIFQWTISNSPCAASSSTVAITVNGIPTIANAGANQTLCISSPTTIMNGNPALVGTGAWTLISGSGTITNSLSPTTSITGLALGINIFQWSISNPPCAPSTSTVAIVVNDIPTIASAGPNQQLCNSSPNTVMSANTATIGNGAWTLISGSGTLTNSLSPTTSVTGVGVGTNIFAWTISNSPCPPSSSNVTLIVSQVPTIANAGSNQTLCISSPSTTMNGNFPAIGNGAWTLVSGTGVITNSLLPNTTITGLGLGINVFAWTISNNPCTPSTSNVTITVNPAPTIANAGTNQTLCISSPTTTMNANTAIVGTGVWALVSGSGTITNSLSPTTSITGLGLGANIFAWTISNPPCAPSISNVTITVNQIPSIANAGSNQTICISSPTVTMNGNFPSAGTGVWTLISGSGIITNSLLPNTPVTGLGLGNNIFAWTISNPPCSPSISNVTITVKQAPSIATAGSNQILCATNPNTAMTANTPVIGTGVWALIAGSGIISNSLSPTSAITGLGLGNNIFFWTISNSPCAPSSSNVTITVNQVPTIANAGSNQTLCVSSPSTTMNGNFPTVGTGAWTLVSGSGVITNSLLPTTSITGLAVGTNIFAWTISNNPCVTSSSTVAIVVKDIPTVSNAGPTQTICISSPNTIMAANTPTVGTGAWTLISGSGSITNSLSPTTSITGLGLGTNIFQWTISNSPCAVSGSTMAIVVKDLPTIANAGSNQTLCASSPTTTMNANNAVLGTGAWTLISGSGVITNSLLPTTSVTGLGLGNNVFAWTISNNPCSPSTSNVTITVNQVPTIASAGSNQTLCISNPNTFMAANTAGVGTGLWTLVSGSGTITNPNSPGTSITALSLGTNIFAWTISNSPCAPSVSTVAIIVNDLPTISNAGSNQTLCISSPTTTMAANAPTIGTGLWTLVSGSGSIANPTLPNTAITGIGLGVNVFAWTISNSPCASSVSNVTITVSQIPTIANAGANQTLCISSPNTIMAANTPIVGDGSWSLLAGTGTITNSLSPTTSVLGLGLGTNIFQWTIANSPCASSTATMSILVNDIPTIANAGPTQTICFNVPNVIMAANTPTIGTGSWSILSGSGTITNSLSPITSVTGIGLGVNVFEWSISNPPCASSVSTMTVIVNPGPTIANAGPSQTLCITSNSTTMAGNVATSGTGQWSLVSGSGIITNSLSPTTTITGLGLGTNIFAWTIYDNPCVPSSSTVAILVNDVPTISTAGSNQTVCITSPNAIMAANTPTVGTGVWTLISGTGTITTTNSPITSITNLGVGTNVFMWTISNSPCASSSSTVSVRVRRLPTPAVAGLSQTLCISSNSTTMAANTPTIGNGLWTLLAGSGTIANPTSPTSAITGLGLGTNIFEWTISNSPCSPSSSTVAIIVNDVPTVANAGPSQTLCISSNSTTLAGNTPTVGTGIWTLLSGSGTITNPSSPNTTLTGLGLGINIFEWTISNVPCTSSSATVAIIVNDIPTPAIAGASQTICISSSNTFMSANSPTVGSGLWTLISGSGSLINPTLPNTTVTGLGLGTNIFQWTIANAPCLASTSTMAIVVNNIPTIANAGLSQTLCISSNSTIMTANTPTAGTGIWTLVSGSGTIANPNIENTTITGLGLGTNVFAWTISNPPCAVSSSTVALIVKDIPTIANAGFSQTVCITSPNAFMNANTATVGTGAWTLVSGSGTITNSLSPATSITGMGLGVNIFAWTISNSPCASTASTVAITVNDIPTVANAGGTQTLCISSNSTTMAANLPTVGTGVWTLVSGSGIITNPNIENTTITGLALGTNVFAWTISNPPCLSSSSTVALIVNDLPTASNAGPTQTLCITTPSTTMAANLPTVGTGYWTLVSGSGTITNPNIENTTITGLALGTNVFAWTISNPPCAASISTMAIIVDDKPTPANAGPSQNLCASNFTLNANPPLTGTGMWTVIAGGSSITTPTLSTSTVTGLITGTNTLVWTISNGACASSSSSINLYVNPFPTPANAGPDQNICTNTATLAGNSPAVGFGVWTVVTGSGSVLTNTISNSPVTGLSNGINTFVWTTAFGTCPNSPDTVIILVDSLPSVSLAGSSQTLCATSATLNANNPIVGIGTWSVIAGGSSVTTPTLNSSGITGLATGNNIFEWSIANGTCPASTSTVSIFVDSYPTVSNAGTDFTICASSATLNANTPTIGSGNWAVVTGGSSVTNPNLTNSSVTGLSNGLNSFEWTISNGTCPSSTSTVNIFVDAFPSAVSAGPDQAFCLTTTTANLNASIPTVGVASWSVISGSGTVTTPTLNTSDISGLSTGTNTIVWSNSNGVCPATSDTMHIVLLSFPTPANAGPDQVLCPNSTMLTSNLPAIGFGTWSISLGTGAIVSPTINNSAVTGLSTGTNSLVWTTANGNCPTSSDTVQLIVLPPVQQAYAGNDTTIYTTSLTVNGNIPISGTGQWQFVGGSFTIANPNQNSTQLVNLVPGLNTIKWTITETCGTTEDELNITLVVQQLPNAFSPNGDGINDYFEIPISDYYSQVEIKIVNRWGSLVFEDHDYKNKWNGVNQDGQPLAEDTYFYVIKLDNETKTGYVLIKR